MENKKSAYKNFHRVDKNTIWEEMHFVTVWYDFINVNNKLETPPSLECRMKMSFLTVLHTGCV